MVPRNPIRSRWGLLLVLPLLFVGWGVLLLLGAARDQSARQGGASLIAGLEELRSMSLRTVESLEPEFADTADGYDVFTAYRTRSDELADDSPREVGDALASAQASIEHLQREHSEGCAQHAGGAAPAHSDRCFQLAIEASRDIDGAVRAVRRDMDLIAGRMAGRWVQLLVLLVASGVITPVVCFVLLARRRSPRAARPAGAIRAVEQRVLELLATSSNQKQVLTELATAIERQIPGLRCAILLLDSSAGRLLCGAAPSLPERLTSVFDGLEIGSDVLTCGTAAYHGRRIITENLPDAPAWSAQHELVRELGLGACWSQPVLSTSGEVLGTLALYSRAGRRPCAAELELMERGAQLAGIAIERRRAELALRESEHRFALFMRHLPGLAYLKDENHRMVYLNEAFEEVFGISRSDWLGMTVDRVLPPDTARRIRANDEWVLSNESPLQVNEKIELADGLHHYLSFRFPIRRAGRPTLLGGVSIDLTEHKRVEAERERLAAQLRQSQKMEALGQLAGSVAHDFNNILTVIVGNAEMLLQSQPIDGAEQDPEHIAVQQIQTAGQRATALTRQLLAFSRKQLIKPQVLDLNHSIAEVQAMLQRLVGEDVTFEIELGEGVPAVMMDAGQLQQVLINLVFNGRDALVRGGTLRIRTGRVALREAGAEAYSGLESGTYAVLTIRDNGCGMDHETLGHIFEPFFTTKPPGKGTGLGLSTVYGIVKQAGGDVRVDSVLGRGSAFELLLPSAPAPRDRPVIRTGAAAHGGGEIILLCEDEDEVRRVTARSLREAGYQVLEAEDGQQALDIVDDEDRSLDLLITDVIMPRMNGRQLADTLKDRLPDLPVLFISGYTSDIIDARDASVDLGMVLEKPFGADRLLERVRELL